MLKNLKIKIKLLKQNLAVLIYAYKDKRTPLLAKLIIGLAVGYMLSPIDLIPDFIPVLGLLDDLIIVPLLIRLSIKLIPAIVLTEAEQSIKDNPQKFKKNNWMFAIIIILIWLTLFYIIYKQFSYLWN
jgi:uncharacterized membrane protein YkvA (DUF1232 family)